MNWALETNPFNNIANTNTKSIVVSNRTGATVIPNSSITLRLNNTGATQTIQSGNSTSILQGSSYLSTTSNERFNPGHPGISITESVKHQFWDIDPQQFTINQNFALEPTASGRVAIFNPVSAATVRPDLIDAPSSGTSWSGVLEMKDPWYYNGTSNPNSFIPYSSSAPFNQTGTYKNTGGVFTGIDPLSAPVFYAVRAPQTQSVNGYPAEFQSWQASNATLQNPSNLETAVRFNAPNAVVTARYKGRLLSSLANATSSGSQRTLANAQGATLYNNVFYLVYESAGKIWLTYSTNSGTSWTNERYLGDGKNPTVAASSQFALIAWNTGSGQLNCRLFSYDPVAPGGTEAEVQSQTLGGGSGSDDVPFIAMGRTTGVLSNQT
ncbi:MAG: hypothetical protein SNJ66_10075, partial [Chloroherpetonaceae bacterium]